ncbi:hypothetical protein MTR67_039220 [Solanum verrucosum]|uniref:Uncharacterized protein n=1 Tax=Solanum verrucosum TaxID=315347 RepID=A0AAF0UGJ2_SOLVR|nr:hypothetical protein MTR67_039220 [Solanum verrucosum]
MALMMTQMDLLTKHVIGSGYKVVNAVGINSCVNPNEAHFEAIYNEIEQFLANQVGGSCLSYPKPGGIEVGIEIEIMVGKIDVTNDNTVEQIGGI